MALLAINNDAIAQRHAGRSLTAAPPMGPATAQCDASGDDRHLADVDLNPSKRSSGKRPHVSTSNGRKRGERGREREEGEIDRRGGGGRKRREARDGEKHRERDTHMTMYMYA